MPELLRIPASEVQLQDVLGEGQVVWMMAKGPDIRIYWGPPDRASWFRMTVEEKKANVIKLERTDIVCVLRR